MIERSLRLGFGMENGMGRAGGREGEWICMDMDMNTAGYMMQAGAVTIWHGCK